MTTSHSTDTPNASAQDAATASASAAAATRRERFERDLDQMRVRTSSSGRDARLALVGLIAMAVGLVIALVAFVVSGSQSDTRDVLSTVILAVFGAGLVVAGAVVFLRYSLAGFLRLWMLRLIFEQRSDDNLDDEV